MFKCSGCGYIFDEPEEYVETHGFTYGPYERWHGCPKCASAYDELFECKVCGELYTEEELHSGMCDNCYEIEDEEDE